MNKERTISMAVNTCNMQELARLSKLAIGGRTLRDFSSESELSEGFLSRLTTGKLKSAPTRRSLAKLTAETSHPQNGITLGDLMRAAGYNVPDSVKTEQGTKDEVPRKVLTAAFPVYLIVDTLETTGQLGANFSSESQREMFIIKTKGRKDIVGIPAFCASNVVEDEIRNAKWKLMMALSIYEDKGKDAFFVIITNQNRLYDDFDQSRVVGTGGEFYIALTEDYKSFSRQRPVKTKDLDGRPENVADKEAYYDFTKKPEFIIE